ncbi:hypothetical protein CLIB1444_03S06656 [[Candida] jaroonii]|uniref:Uncharacterized protein n=1 Tax=[Candida] jaroonii TaxID=467808 RepID=A0ACA9Y6D5_9ASCO|nr:hypothetical protein CLIB1444_03S06656 [[Candida] jaroonii]
MSFEDWKRIKVKNETNYRNTSLVSYANSENRFNYASIDCAAKIISTNDGAKEAKSVLKDDKDSYLINKCSSPEKFVIIELCQDILIDLVEIGNFEFFSSNFKRIKISVNERYEDKNWKSLGEFEATNSRDLQKFKISNPIIWAKYLRIDILDHYGNEFYCPISLIKVYGKTMIEDFKEETIKQVEEEIDECKVSPSLPYLELNQFLSTIPEYCNVEDETTTIPQDSIYKSIIKRLSLLESNASLSLLYLQEQSKLLSNSFSNLQQQHQTELEDLVRRFNVTVNEQILKLDQFNQLKLFESNKLVTGLANDLSFYKKLLLINFFLLIILLIFTILSNEIPLEIPKPTYQFKVGQTKKKYNKKFKYKH